ncbi:hypothetical protein BATDEDRAFT_91827 [Batrachochytrium dendrobatidis JAM81]|uniref:EF-hand domain-containing protein n=1 Tax=Batrachochytrium dendrobatidis (strain JAM81 / FGSC 10211) TaxID=684364 RepID=F4PBH4_BATDJ|nr:uncharacterized protein BATDEDRAFT_91827 [Batrachochytrium dendrobatidis JAM81]EGF77325.1 hypothetical protein BATDEDRAFT_91827 [Batrachochytrium dendrobatidis JAM81]|eukprot:XP_006682042.1 hypothetical protein BATDEDRAFT_91827 [Batrachochytrium dendrobatidis JAM81]
MDFSPRESFMQSFIENDLMKSTVSLTELAKTESCTLPKGTSREYFNVESSQDVCSANVTDVLPVPSIDDPLDLDILHPSHIYADSASFDHCASMDQSASQSARLIPHNSIHTHEDTGAHDDFSSNSNTNTKQNIYYKEPHSTSNGLVNPRVNLRDDSPSILYPAHSSPGILATDATLSKKSFPGYKLKKQCHGPVLSVPHPSSIPTVKPSKTTRDDFLFSPIVLNFASGRKMPVPMQPYRSKQRIRLKPLLDDHTNTKGSKKKDKLPVVPIQQSHSNGKTWIRKSKLYSHEAAHSLNTKAPEEQQRDYFRVFSEMVTLPPDDPRLARLLPYRFRKSIRLYGVTPMVLLAEQKQKYLPPMALQPMRTSFTNLSLKQNSIGQIQPERQQRIDGPEIEPKFSSNECFDSLGSFEEETLDQTFTSNTLDLKTSWPILPINEMIVVTDDQLDQQAEYENISNATPDPISNTKIRDTDQELKEAVMLHTSDFIQPTRKNSKQDSKQLTRIHNKANRKVQEKEHSLHSNSSHNVPISKPEITAHELDCSNNIPSRTPVLKMDESVVGSYTDRKGSEDTEQINLLEYESRQSQITDQEREAEYLELQRAIKAKNKLKLEHPIMRQYQSKNAEEDEMVAIVNEKESKGVLASALENMSVLNAETKLRMLAVSAPLFKNKPLLGMPEMETALKDINSSRKLSDQEIEYIKNASLVFELVNDDTVDQQEFIVIASLAERMTLMDQKVRLGFYDTDFKKLGSNIKQYKKLFTVYTEEDGQMTYEDLKIMLLSSGSSEQQVGNIAALLNFKDKSLSSMVGFLDFLSYVPFFTKIHEDIINNPFGDSAK